MKEITFIVLCVLRGGWGWLIGIVVMKNTLIILELGWGVNFKAN